MSVSEKEKSRQRKRERERDRKRERGEEGKKDKVIFLKITRRARKMQDSVHVSSVQFGLSLPSTFMHLGGWC